MCLDSLVAVSLACLRQQAALRAAIWAAMKTEKEDALIRMDSHLVLALANLKYLDSLKAVSLEHQTLTDSSIVVYSAETRARMLTNQKVNDPSRVGW